MKTSVLLALGLLGTNARKHHSKHQQKHTAKLTNQMLQGEIEELREAYISLEQKYEKLENQVQAHPQSMVQAQGPALFGLAGAGGPAQPSPQPFVRGEKQWMNNAQNIGDWGENQMVVANTRIPYQSTAQLEATPNLYGLAPGADKKPTPGGPAQPSPQPFVRGEKQWMDNAQNIGDWGENQMEIANARIPYFSTVQLESSAAPNKFGLSMTLKGVPIAGSPAQPSPQPFVRGEKQWMDNAQNINDWGDKQMTVANTRIPYWSTFVQTESDVNATPNKYGLAPGADKKPTPGGPAQPSPQPFVRGEKQWMDNAQNIGNWGENQMEIANARIPYFSTLVQTESEVNAAPNKYGLAPGADKKPAPGAPAQPSPQPFVRGEKQWQDNAANIQVWGDQQVKVANERIPYASTFIQTRDDEDEEQQKPDPIEKVLIPGSVPLTAELIQTKNRNNVRSTTDHDDDVNNIEGMMMEKTDIPLNLRLLQMRDDDPKQMEGMMMEKLDLPLDMRLIHIETEEGDELIKMI